MAVATVESEAPARKGPSSVIQLAVVLVLTLAAIGGGWFAGKVLHGGGSDSQAAVATHEQPAKPPVDKNGEPVPEQPSPVGDGHSMIIPLAPITTNLAAPANVWVRMEISLVFDSAPDDPTLADSIHQDLLAYLRTIKMHQIEGASGFQHLRADLDERASIRSDGLVKRVLIRTLLFE